MMKEKGSTAKKDSTVTNDSNANKDSIAKKMLSDNQMSSTGVKKPVWKKPSKRLPSKKLIENQLSKSSTTDEELDKSSAGAKKPPTPRMSKKMIEQLLKTSTEDESDQVSKTSTGPKSKEMVNKFLLESSTDGEEDEIDRPSTSSGRVKKPSTRVMPSLTLSAAKSVEKEKRKQIISDESDDNDDDDDDERSLANVSSAVKRNVPDNDDEQSEFVPTKKVRQGDDTPPEPEVQAENDELDTTSESETDCSESASSDVKKVIPLYQLDDEDCLVCDDCERKFDNAKLLEDHLVNDHEPLF